MGEEKQPREQRDEPARKIGADHLKGMARLGFHEMANALQALPDSNMKAPEEPGVFGNENFPQRPLEEKSRSQAHLNGLVRTAARDDQDMVR